MVYYVSDLEASIAADGLRSALERVERGSQHERDILDGLALLGYRCVLCEGCFEVLAFDEIVVFEARHGVVMRTCADCAWQLS